MKKKKKLDVQISTAIKDRTVILTIDCPDDLTAGRYLWFVNAGWKGLRRSIQIRLKLLNIRRKKMADYLVELHELEVFQVLDEFADAAVDRALNVSILPNRHYESETVLKIRLLLAEKKIAKYEGEITRLMDLNREAGRELSRAFEDGVGYVQLPHITKRNIEMLSRQIEEIKEEARLFALRFGWQLIGRVDPDTAEWQFQKINLREILCKKF